MNKANRVEAANRLNHKFNRPETTVIFHKEIKFILTIQFTKTSDLTLTREFDTPCAVPTKEVYRD